MTRVTKCRHNISSSRQKINRRLRPARHTNLGMLISIDPGNDTGWAIFRAGSLVDAGVGDPRTSTHHRLTSPEGQQQDTVDEVWIESQVCYPRSKVPPNDLIKLAQSAGRWAGRYDSLGVEAHFVEPSIWKGQVPKEIHQQRIVNGLTTFERSILLRAEKSVFSTRRHNMLDAIGIGLWALAATNRRAT